MRQFIHRFYSWTHSLVRRGAESRMVSGFLLVAMLTMGAKAVSFLKDAAVASQFGTGDALDAFFLSFGLLSFSVALFGGGLPESFLPVYAEMMHQEGAKRAQRLAVQSSLIHAGSLLLLALVSYFVAPHFVQWATRGFHPEKQALAVGLLRQLLPFMVCFGMSYQLSAWLRADKQFLIATSAPMAVPLMIMAALFQAGSSATVQTLVTGAHYGAIVHLAILVIALMQKLPWDVGFWGTCLTQWEPQIVRVGRHALHFLFAGGIFSSSAVVDQTMAAWLAPGSVAVLGYTEKICGIILAVTATPSCDVLFPYFADKVARRDWLGVRQQIYASAGLILALALPAALALCALAPWVIAILFQRGSFTAEDTQRVAEVLRYAALQIPFYIVGSLVSRVVVAMQATHFIIILSVVALLANASLNWVLMQTMGAAGIALSTVLVQMTSALLACLYVLRQIRQKIGL